MAKNIKLKINYTALFAVIFSLLLCCFVSTQFFALKMGFHKALGCNYRGIYYPWDIIIWFIKWHHVAYRTLTEALGLGIFFYALFLLLILFYYQNNFIKKNYNLYGSAKWASKADIINASLLPTKNGLFSDIFYDNSLNDTVCIGGWEDNNGNLYYLRHSGAEHILTYAPTRSGKGVGLVIPSLLTWKESCIITDLKGELWELTSGWRKNEAFNKVLRFEPASSENSICWNPLDEIRIGTDYEISDVQNLVNMILDPDGKGLENHWQKTAFSLLNGVVIHAVYKAKNEGKVSTLFEVDNILSSYTDIKDLWDEMLSYEHLPGQTLSIVKNTAIDMINRAYEEASSIVSTAKSYLSLYRDPVIQKNTGKSDFKIRDLMNYKDPISLYVITQPGDLDRLRPLIRILLNMSLRLLTTKIVFENGKPKKSYKHKLLMMLDEFASLGKLEIFQRSLGYIAGYGIKCYLICQDINQLKSQSNGYGQDETITSNCHIQNAFPPNRIETAEHLSKLTGETTVIKEQITSSGKTFQFLKQQESKSFVEVKRPLLTPDECLRMKGARKNHQGEIVEPGDMVIYVSGYPAIYGKQLLYFKDKEFIRRSSILPPSNSDLIFNNNVFKL